MGSVGVAVAAGFCAPRSLAWAVAEGESPGIAPWPLVGAVYETGYRRSGRHWRHVDPFPALGSYCSGDPGAIATHKAWARQAGLDFFLARYRGDRPYQGRNISTLFHAGSKSHPRIAVMIEADKFSRLLERGRRQGKFGTRTYVDAMARWFAERYDEVALEHRWFDNDVYLRGEDGRPIVGFSPRVSAALGAAVLKQVERLRPEIGNESWIWYASGPGAAADRGAIYRALAAGKRRAFFAADPGLEEHGWREAVGLYEVLGAHFDQRVVSVSPRPGDGGPSLLSQLEALRDLRVAPSHVIVNSFNDWRAANAVEPSTSEDRVHLEALSSWRA